MQIPQQIEAISIARADKKSCMAAQYLRQRGVISAEIWFAECGD